jgi:hypothetical protein
MFAISITTNIGMWFERFVITITSLHRDFLPASWDYYSPTIVDVLTFVGSFGLFFTLFLLFLRFVPMVAISEVKAVMPQADPHYYEPHGDGHGTWNRPRPSPRSGSARPPPTPAATTTASDPPPMANFLTNALRQRSDQNVGLLAEFAHPGDLYEAVKAARKEGYSRIDTFSPFPIHGMDKAMGLGPSPLGYLVIIGGLTGLALGVLMQWWMSAVDYPLNISGKPIFAWESAVPVNFEITVLFSALTAVGGMLALNALPRPYNPLFNSERFSAAPPTTGSSSRWPCADSQVRPRADGRLPPRAWALHVEYVDHTGAYDVAEGGALIRVEPRPEPSASGNGAPGADPPLPLSLPPCVSPSRPSRSSCWRAPSWGAAGCAPSGPRSTPTSTWTSRRRSRRRTPTRSSRTAQPCGRRCRGRSRARSCARARTPPSTPAARPTGTTWGRCPCR